MNRIALRVVAFAARVRSRISSSSKTAVGVLGSKMVPCSIVVPAREQFSYCSELSHLWCLLRDWLL